MKCWISCVIILFVSIQTSHSQKYNIEKKPNWVAPIDLPGNSLVSKYGISTGFYLTLADYQVNLEEDAVYNHEVINVVSYSGITKSSQLVITYDTSYQRLMIHHLYIWRKGEKIDRTGDLSFEILNNEHQLSNGIYMGRITAYDNLDDIRKDDLIDFAYTLVGKNPIFGNEKYLFIPLESANPIDLYSIRILYPRDKDYSYKCVDCDSSIHFSTSTSERYQHLEIIARNMKSMQLEDYLPSWVIPYKYFTLSSFKTWTEVNKWAQSVFALKTEPGLESVDKELFTGKETDDEKINKMIDFVQDDIRYMGIESGIGSIKPFPPDQVVKQRFGDCKDKSLLLVSLLKKHGITEAYPALVNSSMKHETGNLFPSSEVFNHCIVTFNYKDITHWVDPTLTQQGGDFKDLSIPEYGMALVIGKPSDTLTLINTANFRSAVKMVDTISMNSFTEPATLVIKSIRSGLEADIRRIGLEQVATSDISKMVTDDLKLLYPTVNRTADLLISDDIKNNILSTTYFYTIDGFWQDGDKLTDKESAGLWLFKYEPHALYQYLNVTACDDRLDDYALSYPMNLEYRVVFNFPRDLLIIDKYEQFDNEAFFFDEKIEQLSASSFQITYNFNTKKSSVKASSYLKVCEEKNKIAKELPMVIYFKK